MKNKRYRKELMEEVNRTNIVISDKIIPNKYDIILCKNKWKNTIERIFMKLELLQKAIEEEKNVFSEVNNAAYSLEPVSEERLVEIAKDVNEQLGYELYDKLDRESLVADFSSTSREMYKHTLEKSKFLNDRLEKALVEHCDDILVDVVKAHENFDSMETYELYTLAFEVNEKLGYRLFRDIYSYSLRRDFERVAKSVETYKKEGKITKFMK